MREYSFCRADRLMVILAATASMFAFSAPAFAQGARAASDDIIVTARKREDSLSRVPASVAAITGSVLQERHVETIQDIARITPGLVFQSNAGSGQQRNSAITVRGIASVNGVATVGVYLDETPMTIRNIATGSTNNFYPALFDLARIEVLRGPQGTLFGSGSMGGTVRFISEKPSVDEYSGHALAEAGVSKGGSASYQAGVALGGPLAGDKIGFRMSGYYRHDGGFVDKYNFNTGALIRKNANYDDTYSGKLSLLFKPTDDLEIMPSIFVQHLRSNDVSKVTLPATLNTVAGLPGPTVSINQREGNYTTNPNILKDDFQVASLDIKYDFGLINVNSITSYLHRVQRQTDDIHTWVQLFTGAPDPFVPGAPNYDAFSPDRNKVRSFTQEVRFSSDYSADNPFSWVAGVYYSKLKQVSTQWVYSRDFADLVTLPGIGAFFATVVPTYVQGTSYDVLVRQGVDESQLSAFGQLDFKILSNLTLSAGLRFQHDDADFFEEEGGPLGRNGGGPGLQNIGPRLAAAQKGDTFIPKFTASWQIDPANLIYATAAKGYRPGGQNTVNEVVTTPACAAGLDQLGLDAIPLTYDPDSVWSYEVGTKNRFLGDAIQVSGSAFYIKWNNVQQAVNIGCTTPFTANLGSASSRGFDLSLNIKPTPGLSLGADVGYTHARFDENLPAGSLFVARAGDKLPNIVPWTVSLHSEYEFAISETSEAYIRADYQWLSREPAGSPQVVGYDPTIRSNGTFGPNPSYGLLNLRAGLRKGKVDISAFLLNATNENPRTNFGREQFLVSSIYRYNRIRPITGGVTATFRY